MIGDAHVVALQQVAAVSHRAGRAPRQVVEVDQQVGGDAGDGAVDLARLEHPDGEGLAVGRLPNRPIQERPWDLVALNPECIREDASILWPAGDDAPGVVRIGNTDLGVGSVA